MNHLKKKLCDLTVIEDWYDFKVSSNTNKLYVLFNDLLHENNVFLSIYISVRVNPTSESAESNPQYDYYNVGFDEAEIADYFNTRFGCNYFLYDFRIESSYNKLLQRMKAIYNTNLYKYRKLIEVLGYRYNPLYNVDGTELHSNVESIGDSKSIRAPSGTIKSVSGTETNNTIGDTTTTNYTNPYDSSSSSDPDYINDKTTQSPITTKQTYEEYQEENSIDNFPAQGFRINSSTGTLEKTGLYTISASDSAFGVSLEGAERYYAEKRIRQGNIGVTKSTELIEAQRNTVRYNILDEFFRDLEKEIVVGIYV